MRVKLTVFVLSVVLGSPARAQPFPEQIELGAMAPGEGFSIPGLVEENRTGDAVAGIGDINHDGFDDLAVGAVGAEGGGFAGSAYIIFGFPAANLESFDLNELDGSNGFRVDGLQNGDQLGQGVAGAGDINGDGIDDLLIGAPSFDGDGTWRGTTYLIFGRPNFPAVVRVDLLDGTNGSQLTGINNFDGAGLHLSGLGDFNNDGLGDFLVSASSADPNGAASGEAYVGFGRTTWPKEVLAASLNGENGFTINGIDKSDHAGSSVSSAGDVNGDGIPDLIIGAVRADPGQIEVGESYIVFGGNPMPAFFELSALDGTNGVALRGVAEDDNAGASVAGLGDINHDGFDDVLVGADLTDGNGSASGSAYIVYGRGSWPPVVRLGDLNGADGTTLNGFDIDHRAGESVGGLFDFNGDGFLDALIGAPGGFENVSYPGTSYVLFGNDSLPATLELDDLDGFTGVKLEGEANGDLSGSSVSGVGDFNGDGLGDVVVGSWDAGNRSGTAHVVFGRYETGIALGATGAACPGLIELRSKGLTENGELEIYRGSGRGASTIESGPCAGSELDLEDAQLVRTAAANDRGQWLFSVDLGNDALCGASIQVIDRTSCSESNVATLPGESPGT